MSEPRNTLYGVIGEFDSPKTLMAAARKVREAGYEHFDAFAPFPIPGLSEACGLHYGLKGWKHNFVPQLTLLGGLGGGLTGFFFQYWVSVTAYPLNIAGRPLNSWPAFHSGHVRIDRTRRFVFRGIWHARAEQIAAAALPAVHSAAFQARVR